ncbi:MAG: hypothetical protein AAFX93_18815 [Verrucomicrobiota bacterium]
MKISVSFLSSILAFVALSGCESAQVTPEQRATYEKEKKVLDYETQRQADEFKYLSDDEPVGYDN